MLTHVCVHKCVKVIQGQHAFLYLNVPTVVGAGCYCLEPILRLIIPLCIQVVLQLTCLLVLSLQPHQI